MARGSIPHRNDRRSIVNSPEFEPVQYTICLHFICPGLCIRGSWLLQAEVVGFWAVLQEPLRLQRGRVEQNRQTRL